MLIKGEETRLCCCGFRLGLGLTQVCLIVYNLLRGGIYEVYMPTVTNVVCRVVASVLPLRLCVYVTVKLSVPAASACAQQFSDKNICTIRPDE